MANLRERNRLSRAERDEPPVSDQTTGSEPFEALPETPVDPGEVASAARSCSVLLVIIAALALIVCAWVGVIVLK